MKMMRYTLLSLAGAFALAAARLGLQDHVPRRSVLDGPAGVAQLHLGQHVGTGLVGAQPAQADQGRVADGAGEIGFISSVSQPFCGACSRARLSSEGVLYTCLFATAGWDLRTMLRSGADDAAIARRTAELQQYAKDRKMTVRGEPLLAFYNPPWTLPFFRRNEILFEIAGP